MTARSKVRVYGRSFAGIAGSVYCQEGVCASGPSLIQRSPIKCDASDCDFEASIMRRS